MRISIILVGGFLAAMAVTAGFALFGESESLDTPKISFPNFFAWLDFFVVIVTLVKSELM